MAITIDKAIYRAAQQRAKLHDVGVGEFVEIAIGYAVDHRPRPIGDILVTLSPVVAAATRGNPVTGRLRG